MSRLWRCAAVVAATLAPLAGPSAAGALPRVTVSAVFVPIPGFPNTGNIAGAGAALETSVLVAGSEYAGAPWPLVGLRLWLPRGTVVRLGGFLSCAPSAPAVVPICPPTSSLGRPGSERIERDSSRESWLESAVLRPLLVGQEELDLVAEGLPPAPPMLAGAGRFALAPIRPGLGPLVSLALTPVANVSGQRRVASVRSLVLYLGSAVTGVLASGARTTSYVLRVPRTCPKGGFVGLAELTFLQDDLSGDFEEVSSPLRMPCPRRRLVAPPGEPGPAPAPPPVETALAGTHGVVFLTSDEPCLSGRSIAISLHGAGAHRLRRATISVNGRPVKSVRGAATSLPIALAGLPEGSYTVTVAVVTRSGRRLAGSRDYESCAPATLPAQSLGVSPPAL